jgi:PAS domain S-box-containing protein
MGNYLPSSCYWLDEQNKLIGCNTVYQNFLDIDNPKTILNKEISTLEKEHHILVEITNTHPTSYGVTFEKKYINKIPIQYFKVTHSKFLGITLVIEENVTMLMERISRLESEINTLKRHEEQTNAYLDNVIRIVPASIYWKDINFVIRGSNLFHTQLAGFSDPKEVIGKTEYDFVWKEQAAEIIEHDKEIMALGKGIRLEENATLADGAVHTFLTSKEPLRDKKGHIIGIIGISIDITEQKEIEDRAHKAEALALLAQSKADFEEETRKILMILVGDIVHDLRTPIATLRSVGVLLSTLFPDVTAIIDEARELGSQNIKQISTRKLKALQDNTLIKSIHNSVTMMDAFIDSTLKELANAQKGLQSDLSWDELTQCSSRRILENTLDAFSLDPLITLHKNTSYDFDLKGNSILIMKILFNVLRNAVDQIHLNGKGEIYVETCEQNEVNQIKIKDTAGGAAPEILSKMFDGYFTTKKSGTGIGLASCKKIMELFGGRMEIKNAYGQYIEFILSFPKIENQTNPRSDFQYIVDN